VGYSPAGAVGSQSTQKRAGVVLWIGLVALVGYTFALFDWGWGLLRGAVLVLAMVAGLALVRLRRGASAIAVPRWLARVAAALASALVAYHLVVAVQSIRATQRLDAIRLDQGQTLYRALRFFPDVNPYGRGVLLDPVYYIVLIQRHYHRGCLTFPIPPPERNAPPVAHEAWRAEMLARVTRLWWRYDLSAADELMPVVAARPDCEDARVAFDTLGFKYGPLTLAAFVPGVAVLDKAGVFLTQTVLLLAMAWLVWWLAFRRAGGDAAVGWIALAALLCTPSLRNNLLLTSALDGTATALSLGGLALWQRRMPTSAAAAWGCALGAKLLPSLLYVPILLAAPRRTWLVCLACAAAIYAPFVVWDAEGLYDNIVLFPLTRGSNTTALAHYLPTWAQLPFAAVFALGILWALRRALRARFAEGAVMRYLLVAHLGLLAGSTILHNNYTIWFAPILALFTAELMVAVKAPAAPASDA
jgi:hypothetical protein